LRGEEVKLMNIKKLAVGISAGALMFSAIVIPAFAKVETVPGPVVYGPWTVNAPSTIDFVCGGGHYVHTLATVNDLGGGNINGTGYYNPDHSYTWNMTGNVNINALNMQIVYTGTAAGSVYNLAGVIAPDGSVSGTSDSNCQTFTMPAESASRTSSQFTGNHGQYVSSQDNKQEAAQSRVGMPVQSNGHTN
jgi:hypothetical protein